MIRRLVVLSFFSCGPSTARRVFRSDAAVPSDRSAQMANISRLERNPVADTDGKMTSDTAKQRQQTCRVLLIGGSGNLSGACCEVLVDAGHEVTVFRRGTAKPQGVEAVVSGDRYDAEAFVNTIKEHAPAAQWDVVIDFLCYKPEHAKSAVEAFKDTSVKQVIHISTCALYRKPHEKIPIAENSEIGNKFSEYARLKIATENEYKAQKSVFTTFVRPSHTFGETWLPSPLHSADYTVMKRILEGKPVIIPDDGETMWVLTWAADFSRAVSGLCLNEHAMGEHCQAYNITTDEILTWNGIYDEIERIVAPELKAAGLEGVGIKRAYIPTTVLAEVDPIAEEKLIGDKSNHGVFSTRKIKQALPDWQCETSLRNALTRAIEYKRTALGRKDAKPESEARIEKAIEYAKSKGALRLWSSVAGDL